MKTDTIGKRIILHHPKSIPHALHPQETASLGPAMARKKRKAESTVWFHAMRTLRYLEGSQALTLEEAIVG